MSAGVRWRVRRDLMAAKAAGAAGFAVLALASWSYFGDRAGAFLAAGAAALLGVLALRDLLSPVRLAADPGGLTVVEGFAGRRRLSWPEVVRVEVREHNRYGLRWRLLEIETGDDLYQFGAHELGVPCVDAAAELTMLRAAPDPRLAPRTAPPSASPGAAGDPAWDATPDTARGGAPDARAEGGRGGE
jgi:hypothetical protein